MRFFRMKLSWKKTLSITGSVLFIVAVLFFAARPDQLLAAAVMGGLLLLFWGAVELIYRHVHKQY
jgi:hypothetical protein